MDQRNYMVVHPMLDTEERNKNFTVLELIKVFGIKESERKL